MSDREVIECPAEEIHSWFGLTYANYLVLPRSVLQSMPDEWQSGFVAMLRDLEVAYGHLDWPEYAVNARGDGGRFIKDPIPHYNRGRTRIEPRQSGDDDAPQ
jgi:hypothetical protein